MSLNPELGVVNPGNTYWVKVVDSILEADLMKDIQYISEQIERDSRLTLRELRGYIHQCEERVTRNNFAEALRKSVSEMLNWAQLQGKESEVLWTERVMTVYNNVNDIVDKALKNGEVEQDKEEEITTKISDIDWNDPERQTWLLSLPATTDSEAVRTLNELSQRPEALSQSASFTSLKESVASSSLNMAQFYNDLCSCISVLKRIAEKESISTSASLDRSLHPLKRYLISIHSRLKVSTKKETVPKVFPRPGRRMVPKKPVLRAIPTCLRVSDLRKVTCDIKNLSPAVVTVENARASRMRLRVKTENASARSFQQHPQPVVTNSGLLGTTLSLMESDSGVRDIIVSDLSNKTKLNPPTGVSNTAVQLSKLVALRCVNPK
eukprot:TRINITY_DN30546_c0_g1_i1.p1 TRINITY_DN30546_c0_g1~~TRINITY_DN30546_c0_g1_i1.p1  ORF type:complete len:380 (+),score=48.94 TRINITY_DN30546_c0_g1_i1:67-1206(+)